MVQTHIISFYDCRPQVGAGIPKDALLLTLGCGKFRLMGQDYGALPNGLPRLLDMVRRRRDTRFCLVALYFSAFQSPSCVA